MSPDPPARSRVTFTVHPPPPAERAANDSRGEDGERRLSWGLQRVLRTVRLHPPDAAPPHEKKDDDDDKDKDENKNKKEEEDESVLSTEQLPRGATGKRDDGPAGKKPRGQGGAAQEAKALSPPQEKKNDDDDEDKNKKGAEAERVLSTEQLPRGATGKKPRGQGGAAEEAEALAEERIPRRARLLDSDPLWPPQKKDKRMSSSEQPAAAAKGSLAEREAQFVKEQRELMERQLALFKPMADRKLLAESYKKYFGKELPESPKLTKEEQERHDMWDRLIPGSEFRKRQRNDRRLGLE